MSGAVVFRVEIADGELRRGATAVEAAGFAGGEARHRPAAGIYGSSDFMGERGRAPVGPSGAEESLDPAAGGAGGPEGGACGSSMSLFGGFGPAPL